ncbi:MAG: flagellar hook-associated protein FlgL [Methylotenera sp.]|nr:flagellar hook-associated protein FlgL [Methylotenera sp.]
MRISTNTIYQSGISKISQLQSEQVKLQQQISTGRRIASPSDDPVGSARALEVSHAQSINAKFADTRQTAQLKLNTIESNLTSLTSMMISTQSSLVAAGNATFSDQERQFIATELSGTLEAMIGLANTKDAAGNYLYAGFKTDTPPFDGTKNFAAAIPPAVTPTIVSSYNFKGDGNQQLLQVDTERQMAVNVTGNNVFQAGGNDIFATISNLVTLLNTPLTAANQANFSAGIAAGIGNMQTGLDNVLNVRAAVGSKLNELDTLDTAGTDRDLQYSKSLSELQDLDYASALSDLSKNQTIMEAAQKSFVATTSLSLFDFI